ncbi:D-inositol-3-phosphate glycosyltransferase [Neolewinella maritima]|uniref:D-inositol-3-phosphate glycosyltransferase n=1 Tax=Neolewinella maritima TaxID=1383882 RepID=A0ABN8F8Q2_9BACT|nr:glycosyltransferase family 1 protein [Neolewinella maritima]CAH1001337.1 D-inositol-3-phosphate glycosyltransferase [Neolewinella maritima]
MQLNLIFRKPYPTAFSIERLFDQLAVEYRRQGVTVNRLELPHYNNTLPNLRKNNQWAGTQVHEEADGQGPTINHITGDVNSVIFSLRRPTVITIHDCNPLLRFPKWHPRYWFYRWCIFEWPARRAAAVTVISEKTRQELLTLTSCSPGNIHLIPNCVDPAFTYRPKAFNTAYPTILQIGVKDNKNLLRLTRALEGLPCRLEIVGQPRPQDIALLDELAIDYHWATGLSDAEVRQRYIDCDLLAFVSTYEGFGLPILEAQVTGRAVLTSALSPHREVAGTREGAVMVDPYSVQAIRAGLDRLIHDDQLRSDLIANGRANAAQYSIAAVAQQYIDLYTKLS